MRQSPGVSGGLLSLQFCFNDLPVFEGAVSGQIMVTFSVINEIPIQKLAVAGNGVRITRTVPHVERRLLKTAARDDGIGFIRDQCDGDIGKSLIVKRARFAGDEFAAVNAGKLGAKHRSSAAADAALKAAIGDFDGIFRICFVSLDCSEITTSAVGKAALGNNCIRPY
jgi:hypothetical protein